MIYLQRCKNATDIDADKDWHVSEAKEINEREYPKHKLTHELQIDKITDFDNPFLSIMEVSKEVIEYRRSDGIDLSATLYLSLIDLILFHCLVVS